MLDSADANRVLRRFGQRIDLLDMDQSAAVQAIWLHSDTAEVEPTLVQPEDCGVLQPKCRWGYRDDGVFLELV